LLLCGVAASFLCHGFCKPTHLQHIVLLLFEVDYFLLVKSKSQRAAANTRRTKTQAKKNCLKQLKHKAML
jgi:hypothetical protein